MKSHEVKGGGGARLHVVETGNAQGRPILLIHGFSQCGLVWSRQLASDLAEDYRLIAMDMRGHGLSEKPNEGYADAEMWADDLDGVIRTLGLEEPTLYGWSYGSLLILDYIRHRGDDSLGGIGFVGGITKLGSPEAMSVLTPELLSLVPGLFTTDAEESERSLNSLLGLFFASEVSPDERKRMLEFNLSVPPYVRQALFARSFDNDDLLPKIRTPALITHGALDAVVKPEVVEQHKAGLPHAEVHIMENAGHAAFWDDPAAFNERLRTFCEGL